MWVVGSVRANPSHDINRKAILLRPHIRRSLPYHVAFVAKHDISSTTNHRSSLVDKVTARTERDWIISRWMNTVCFCPTSSCIILDDRGKPMELQLNAVTYDAKEKIHRASLDKPETVRMVRHWLNQGYTSIFSAFANKRVNLLTNAEKRIVNNCTNRAVAMNENARCTLQVLEMTSNRKKKPRKERNLVKYSRKLKAAAPRHISFRESSKAVNAQPLKKPNDWVGSFRIFRTKREAKRIPVVTRSSYSLRSKNENESPFGEVGRRLTRTLRILKDKKSEDSWQQTLQKLSKKAKEMRIEEKFKKTVEKKFKQKDLNTIYEDDDPMDPDDDLFPNLESLEGKQGTKALKGAMDFARDGVKLGMMLTKQNISGFDKKTLRINSPRFLSISPEENPENTVNILSPSILSLHDQGQGLENLTSVPKLLKGFDSKEREQWLNFIVEASGVSDAIRKMDVVKETMTGRQLPRDDKGNPYYITKEQAGRFLGSLEERKIDVHLRLKRSYSLEQIREMNSTGYTTLNKAQIHIMYGPDSPYHCNATYHKFMQLSEDEMEQHILENVRMAAEMDSFNVREKDIIGSPIALTPVIGAAGSKIASQPMILSPVLLSPLIEAPAVFGILVLTPWLFVPVILSPRLMGSLILSPFVMSPVVLTPLMMHPVILSPGVMDPFILSPMAMTPFILSPVVLCPGVLSPLLMTPLILSPGVLSPFILSPLLLNPIIYSPMHVSDSEFRAVLANFGCIFVHSKCISLCECLLIERPKLMDSSIVLLLLVTFGLEVCSAILTDNRGKPLEISPDQIFYDEEKQVHRANLGKDDAYKLMEHWLNQGYSTLYSAYANTRLHLLTSKEKALVNQCTSKAFGAAENAKCVLMTLEMSKGRTHKPKKERNFVKYNNKLKRKQPKRLSLAGHGKTEESRKHQKRYMPTRSTEKEKVEWVGSFGLHRAKRAARRINVSQKNRYSLIGQREFESPFGEVGRRLTKTLKLLKNKTDEENWEQTMHTLDQRGKEMRIYEKFRKSIAHKFLMKDNNGFFEQDDVLDPTDNLFPELESGMDRKDRKTFQNVMDFARDGVKLGMMLAKQNTSDFDRKTLRINSPRFLSVVPEEDPDNTINILSPSILSLHNQGKGVENLTSVPKLMRGFRPEERDEWMNFIVEASGVSDAVEKIDIAKDLTPLRRRMKDDSGKQLFLTKDNMTRWVGDLETRKVELQGRLMKTYTKQQLRELNTTGYTVLNKDQLYMLYGPESPYNNSEAYNRLLNISKHDINEIIERDIRMAAEMDSFKVRENDIVGSSFLFAVITGPAGSKALSQNIVLTPVVLSIVVEAPAVVGSVVLSPLVFVPFILSPRAVGSIILTPFIFCPIVLNPLAVHPIILSPAVFDPFILTPLLLTPFILDPVVFTPGILAPFCLSPLILDPGVGSPFILSPLLLSPIIFSPQFLFAVVLTPYALSPIIQSPFTLATILLSPGFLS
uniref:Reverse transcriptase domain-containing protein n=1 Tax=Steinernema glaseri TaxID=37863 RepID=A0A1I8A0Q6_9BILA